MCSIDGCGGKVEARGLCRKHYGRWYRHGDALAVDHRTSEHRVRVAGCSIENCGNDHYAKGLCNKHYAASRVPGPSTFTCAHCGKEFRARNHSSVDRYCSTACKTKARGRSAAGQQSVRKWQFKTKYGVSIEDYESLREGQGRGCAICGRVDPIGRVSQFGPDYWLHVDHDHETGNVRGLLCSNCNQAIGLLGENVDNVRRAVAYLEP